MVVVGDRSYMIREGCREKDWQTSFSRLVWIEAEEGRRAWEIFQRFGRKIEVQITFRLPLL